MSNRKERLSIAQRTLEIIERGHYTAPNGSAVQMHYDIKEAIKTSVAFGLDDYDNVFCLRDEHLAAAQHETEITIINETTLSAAKRLAENEALDVLCLNFASAKNPGGGFLGGSEAQEESLARSSGLYPTLTKWPAHYRAHKASRDMMYSDRMIYSPNVPVFLDDDSALLDEHYLTSFVTSPAVNLSTGGRSHGAKNERVGEIMFERMNKLLAIAVGHQHNCLVLGAWGCGVFRNDPAQIADLFARHLLESGMYHNAFKKVVFAVRDNTKDERIAGTFARRFGITIEQSY